MLPTVPGRVGLCVTRYLRPLPLPRQSRTAHFATRPSSSRVLLSSSLPRSLQSLPAAAATATATATAAVLLLATATPIIAFAAPATMSESADAIKAEEHFYDNSYDRRTLLADLKTAYAASPDDIGIMWRLARAQYDVSNLKATPTDDKKTLIYDAYAVMQKALAVGDDVAEVHNWYGIILSSVGDYEGTKVAIANSYKIREHWEKAIALKPSKPTTYHLLGRWCMRIADLGWLERKAAAVLFGSPPESSYDEALTYLLKCDELDPGMWKKNALLVAQVYQRQKNWPKAKEWTQKCLDMPVETEEHEEVHAEATALLPKL